MPLLRIRRILFLVCVPLIAVLLSTGCTTVKYYQKQHFADPIMTLESDPTETHLIQKTLYAREGSVGGIGTGAGGGCGCY